MRRCALFACALLVLVSCVSSHSWLGCADYRGDVKKYDHTKCYAYPRKFYDFFKSQTPDADGYFLGADVGYNYNGGNACNFPMSDPVSANYHTDYKMAVYEQGKTYCLAHPTKNHVAGGSCTNQYIPDTNMAIFRSSVNPTSDPDQATFKMNPMSTNYGKHTDKTIDCLGFQRSPNFCANTGAALATGCMKIPSDLTPGRYVFQWYWAFNNANDLYKTCWDATVVPAGQGNGGGGLTGWENLVDTLTPAGDTCRTNWARTNTNPPLPDGASSIPDTPSNPSGGGGSGTDQGGGGAEGGVRPQQILWVGTFDNYDNSTDLDAWSFGDSTINNAEWKTYIHGPNKMSDWVTIDDDYMDLSAHNYVRQGAAVKLNPQSRWPDAGATMLRTELVAEFGSDAKAQEIMSGTRFFHISLRQPSTNKLDENYEHQLVFMELQGGTHWLDIKYGMGSKNLQVWLGGQNAATYVVPFGLDLFHSFAFEVDFTARTVSVYYSSQGVESLSKVSGPISVPSVAPADWHVGHLRLPLNNAQSGGDEIVHYSSIYVATDVSTLPVQRAVKPGGDGVNAAAGKAHASSLAAISAVALVAATMML